MNFKRRERDLQYHRTKATRTFFSPPYTQYPRFKIVNQSEKMSVFLVLFANEIRTNFIIRTDATKKNDLDDDGVMQWIRDEARDEFERKPRYGIFFFVFHFRHIDEDYTNVCWGSMNLHFNVGSKKWTNQLSINCVEKLRINFSLVSTTKKRLRSNFDADTW